MLKTMTMSAVNTTNSINNRVFSIDAFRLVSIFFVILHHITAFKHSYELYYPNPLFKFLYYFPANVRFLPFFFIAAGYFFGKGILNGEPVNKRLKRYCSRLARLFFVWSLIYAFIIGPNGVSLGKHSAFEVFTANINWAIANPFAFLMKGTIENLWFFPALIIGLTVVVALNRWGKEKVILPLGAVLYVIAMLSKSYSVLPVIGYETQFEMRQGPFISVLFVGIGWLMARGKTYRLKTAVICILSGILLHIVEASFLFLKYGVHPRHDYLFGTVLFCIGIFMFVLSRPNFGKGTFFPVWGKLTLGVYVLHMAFIKFFGMFRSEMPTLVYETLQPFVVFLLSIMFAYLLQKNSMTRFLVR